MESIMLSLANVIGSEYIDGDGDTPAFHLKTKRVLQVAASLIVDIIVAYRIAVISLN